MATRRLRIGPLGLALALLSRALPSFADKAPAGAASQPERPDAVAPAGANPLAPKVELEGPEAEAKDRARVLFGQGVAAYRAGKFYEAVEIFLETQRVYPDTQLCFNVARAYENLGNTSAALRYYRDYLRQADRPSDGAEVQERVRRLEQQLALRGLQQLTVLSEPDGATVLLDGKPVGITPWTGDTYPGKHRLALSLAGFVSQPQIVELSALQAQDVRPALTAQPPLAPPPAPPAPPRRAAVGVGTWVTLGSGLALLGGALVAQAASSDSGLSGPAAFLTGAGASLTGASGVMLYFDLAPATHSAR